MCGASVPNSAVVASVHSDTVVFATWGALDGSVSTLAMELEGAGLAGYVAVGAPELPGLVLDLKCLDGDGLLLVLAVFCLPPRRHPHGYPGLINREVVAWLQ